MHAKRNPNPTIRRSQRILLMVHELHKRGHQRLRISPGLSPSGAYWRCSVAPATNTLPSNGALLKDPDRNSAHYTSGMGNRYFDWCDARTDTARELASKFVQRYPGIAEEGRGRDWAYAGWYAEMLGVAERGCLPIAYADCYPGDEPEEGWLAVVCWEDAPRELIRARVSLPPPAEEPSRGP